MSTVFPTIGLIGTGAMGRGIAQLASQAGSVVRLFDTKPEAAAAAIAAIGEQWDKQVDKGRIKAIHAAALKKRLVVADTLADLADCTLLVEAVVEQLDVKRALFAELEGVVADTAILASNTSSLSITAIAAGLRHPNRFAGLHFFNPVPLMRVVEVIAGLRTDSAVCDQLSNYVLQMGHTPVRAQDTPGFIVNHAGRGYGTEALRIVGEGVADFATIDRILKDQVGFRLGPFELMDLTALDVSHPVMESIYHQYFEEPRYRPSVITAQRLAGGLLGKKVGEGFYKYEGGAALLPPEPPVPVVATMPPVWVSPRAARRADLLKLVNKLGARIESGETPSDEALIIIAPLGFDMSTMAAVSRLDPVRTVGIDMLVEDEATKRRVLATNPATSAAMRNAAHALFAGDGKAVSVIRDSGGFVTQRVLATIINIASDICQQGVCTPKDLETAVMLGLGYPMGPLAMGTAYGAASILEILFNMQTVYADPRYRPSPWLRRRAALGLGLLHEER
ncbi:MAG TPA: 3-hydroxyacyl-CoA dehydrogenase [Burkholderiaceae bacterium]